VNEAMINILLNETNFDQDWAAETLQTVIRPEMNVLMMPLSYNQGWSSDAQDWADRYDSESSYHYDLARPFKNYGIKERQIHWLNYYEEEPEEIERKINLSDILFLVGEDPNASMDTLEDLALSGIIRRYRGIVMGASAGAKIQLSEYYRTLDDDMQFEYRQGLGLLSGFDIDTHYEEDPFHLTGIIRSIESKDHQVIVMPKKGGALISDGHIDLLGEAFIAGRNDLDDLYSMMQSF
jgi:NAD(P)H-dependent FMN reductase